MIHVLFHLARIIHDGGHGTLLFLGLSALATGASWVCYFRALQMGEASKVAPVDKFSLVRVALFAFVFLGERPSVREWLGIGLVTSGVLVSRPRSRRSRPRWQDWRLRTGAPCPPRSKRPHSGTATLDVDATILEAHKRTAAVTYAGVRGYQPVVAVWVEQDLIVHDEFRDGNVPAGCGNVRILERAVATLPAGVTQRFVRGDSALYEQDVLAWCEAPERAIGYAISADMSPQLHAATTRLPASAWQLDRDEPDVIREWAEVPYVPDDGDHRKDRTWVCRYLAMRIRKRQGELFADGQAVKQFVIVTNRKGDGLTLIRWHREKAGTVEHVHHVLKNELAAAALPSGKFGVNAAWFRLNILTYNLLSALKRLA